MKIAIIGSGISGLGAGYLLHPHHEITLYESASVLGGHSRTKTIQLAEGAVPVDTGFIVFNKRNYPHLTALFEKIGVPIAPSNMSFGVSIDSGKIEYGTRRLTDMFAQPANLLRPAFWRMLKDIMRFNKQAHRYLQQDYQGSLKDCLDEMGMGEWFRRYYLLAMGAAIWSTPLAQMEHFPARTFLRFFDNHGLLTVSDQPQWYTVVGGSQQYVKRLSASFLGNIRIGCGVKAVHREAKGVSVLDANGQINYYDAVIFACHSDQVLQILKTPTEQESQALSAIRYQPNVAVLHTDKQFMPKRSRAWSSWVYMSQKKPSDDANISLTYWMNNLQPLPTKTPVLVTLNPNEMPKADLVYDVHEFAHPVFDEAAIQAQTQLHDLQGQDRLWFAGAYTRYGFHEDGLLSAVNIAQKMGVPIPWL